MSTFEDTVLTNLDAINERLAKIERRVTGDEDDPHNRGIYGTLTEVTEKMDDIKDKHRRITDDIKIVRDEQNHQKAWNKGAASAAGINAVGIAAVFVKLFS